MAYSDYSENAVSISKHPTGVAASNAAAPQFMNTDCLYDIPPDENVICGSLIVPEEREQPTGKTIRLHVVIFKSTAAQPAADPLIVLNGGPGSPGQPVVASLLYDPVGEVWRAHRDCNLSTWPDRTLFL